MAFPPNLILTLLFPLSITITLLHHGWANYDQTKVLDYTGLVKEVAYENPHGMLMLEYEGEVWNVVLAPPSRMKARGLTKGMIKVGEAVRVIGYPHKEEKGEMRAERIHVRDKKVELR